MDKEYSVINMMWDLGLRLIDIGINPKTLSLKKSEENGHIIVDGAIDNEDEKRFYRFKFKLLPQDDMSTVTERMFYRIRDIWYPNKIDWLVEFNEKMGKLEKEHGDTSSA